MKYILAFVIAALLAVFFVIYNPESMNESTDSKTGDVIQDTEEAEISSQTSTQKEQTLDLSGQGLTRVPDSVFARSNLEVLDVSQNNLDGSLQAEVRHLQNLRTLDLSNNNFTGVPAEVGQLSKLEILDLSNNPITGLPHEIGNLKNLRILDLRGTNYSEQDIAIIRQGLQSGVEIRVD